MKDKEFIDKYNNSSIEKLTGIGIQLLKNIHSYIYTYIKKRSVQVQL